jgi:hypothetical protein
MKIIGRNEYDDSILNGNYNLIICSILVLGSSICLKICLGLFLYFLMRVGEDSSKIYKFVV